MKQRLTHPGSTGISVLLVCSLHFVLTFLAFIIPVTQSKTTNRVSNLDLSQEHHRLILEELTTKVLPTMKRNVASNTYNASNRILQNQKIREILRKKFNTISDTDGVPDEDIYLADPEIHVFHSSDPEIMVPVQPANKASSAPALTVFKFSTNFQQPDIPYHDLLIKSAILRLRISRQKRKLRRKINVSLNVTFYLMEKSEHTGENGQMKYTPLRSITMKKFQPKAVKVNIESQLLSHLVESQNKIVTVGVQINQTFPGMKKDRNVKSNSQKPSNKTIVTDKHKNTDVVRITKIVLQMTTQTKDLRKARTKREDEDSSVCDDNLCCRHSVYVDFHKIGWDWVSYPDGYTAYYCKGDCVKNYKYASSFTGIHHKMHDLYPDVVPTPACAPIGYHPLTIITNDGESTAHDHPGMVVAGCRCH